METKHVAQWGAWITPGRRRRALLFLIALSLLFALLASVVHSVWLLHWDEATTRALQRFRSPWLDGVIEGITFFGSAPFLIALAVLMMARWYRAGQPLAARFCLLSLLGLPLNWLLKLPFDRARPSNHLVQVVLEATGLSFPSGHAMASTVVYGFLAFLLWTNAPASKRRAYGVMFLALMPLCIGMSRIYLGDHWFSDVIGGWVAGLFCLILLVEWYRTADGNL
ncbi:MAG TPA: phosphatase PAP2 family protein [Ktedonobacteraceae bacterium]|nr:phosphatase PAP2 family protein [Ktedonobacteraceae bacterium]